MNLNYLALISLLFFFCCNNRKDNAPSLDYSIEDNLIVLTTLNENISESSGLLFVNDMLLTHNDSGDDPTIYSIPQETNNINDVINIANASHIDWEDLAQDNAHIYIGDFGNNSGQRQNLVIYKVLKSSWPDEVEAETILFHFSDQSDFDNTSSQHDYNCESMITFEEYIYLFSKNHQTEQTKLYRLSKTTGTHTAQKIGTFDTEGLITGAAIDNMTNTICLLGYNSDNESYDPFVWIFYDFEGSDFFGGSKKRVNLPFHTQMEGICHRGEGQFLISCENENSNGAHLYLFDAEKWKE